MVDNATITPEMAKAELERRKAAQAQSGPTLQGYTRVPADNAAPTAGKITPEMARAELARRRGETPKYSGKALNTTAGINEGIYGTLGAPVDLARGALNMGVRGINAVAGTELPQFPSDGFMGSEWIGNQAGRLAPVLDPDNTEANTTGEKVARGVGQGVGYSIAPEAAVAALIKTGRVAGPVADALTKTFGSGQATGMNTAVGGASGGGATAAMEAAPDEWKPVAGLAGGLAAGVGAAGAIAAGRNIGQSAGRLVKEAVAPMTGAGRERLAANVLQDNATNPAALRQSLDDGAAKLVDGSDPTTFQATGDMGIGGLERGAQARNPELFNQRRAMQNEARVKALSSVQDAGAPEVVAKAVRDRVQQIDDAAQQAIESATVAARNAADAPGVGRSPEDAGRVVRDALEAARKPVKEQERALWKAVDPDGTLVVPASKTKSAAQSILAEMPSTAKPMSGEEAAIFAQVAEIDNATSFAKLYALKSRLTDEIRAEKAANFGETRSSRRMAMLLDGVFGDFETAVARKVAQEADAVARGTMDPAQTVAARTAAMSPQTGNSIYTPSGAKIDVEYEVVDAATLKTSNTPDMRKNPEYAAELQPRDRSRAASDVQVSRIAKDLQPERLGPSSTASDGAPVIGSDGMVESGNARVLAIRRAYKDNGQSAQKYREYLASQGYDTAGMKEPVLVRRRVTEMSPSERVRFAQEANASTSMAMSASDRAASDATRMGENVIRLYQGGDIDSAANRDFVKAFLRNVADNGEEGAFVTANGSLSLDGAQRIRNAMLQNAYNDGGIVASMVDVGDENIRAFGRAMSDISGDVAKLNSMIESGTVAPTSDLSKPIAEAARLIQDARKRGLKLSEIVNQNDAFSQISPEALAIMKIGYGDDLTGRLSKENFTSIMREAIRDAELQTTDARLFGDVATASDILTSAKARYGTTTGSQAKPVSARGAGAGGGESGAEGGRPGSGPAGAADTQGRGAVQGRILDKPELEPNFDAAARERLKAASEATKSRVETFDNKTLGPLRKDMLDSKAPGRVFVAGPAGAETIQTYRKAVGDPAALEAIRDYAADMLRNDAMRPDGTLAPMKVTSFRKRYSEALKAFPELDKQFADAATASDTLATITRQQEKVMANAREGLLGKLIGVDDPSDVIDRIGSVFGAQDSVKRMTAISDAIGDNAEARAGLRKAVADHIANKFVSNAEAGTSGVSAMKPDGFQSFVRNNKPALRAAGFTDAEISTFQNIADDLRRTNRSITAVKNPGGSDTVQNALAVQKMDSKSTILAKAIAGALKNAPYVGGIAGGIAGGFGGAGVGLAAGVGAHFLNILRKQGLETVNDIVSDALLNPDRARILLKKASSPKEIEAISTALARSFRKTPAVAGAVIAERMKDTGAQ